MSGAAYEVLFDGGCGLCTRTVSWLRRLDWRGRLRFVDVNANWDELESSYPGVNREACLEAMHVVAPDGSITAGFDAFRVIAWVVPVLAVLAPLLYVPGVPLVGRAIYGYVAAHRSTTCAIPERPAKAGRPHL